MKRHHVRILTEEMEFSNIEPKSKMKLFHLKILCHIYVNKEFETFKLINVLDYIIITQKCKRKT